MMRDEPDYAAWDAHNAAEVARPFDAGYCLNTREWAAPLDTISCGQMVWHQHTETADHWRDTSRRNNIARPFDEEHARLVAAHGHGAPCSTTTDWLRLLQAEDERGGRWGGDSAAK